MAAILLKTIWKSDPIQNLDHLETNLFLTDWNPNKIIILLQYFVLITLGIPISNHSASTQPWSRMVATSSAAREFELKGHQIFENPKRPISKQY